MCEISRDFPVISGGDKPVTIGDLIDWTPKELITKVMLEEKVFETWYDGRVVLLGDGKIMLSFFGLNVFHCLANVVS